MIKIVVGGQMNKKEIEKIIKDLGGDKIEITVKNDLNAAMDVKNGKVDYYVGACETGGGGSLAMAIAMLGKDKTASLSSPSAIMKLEEIENEVKDGKIAFGFTVPSTNNVLKKLIPTIIENHK